MSDIVNRIEQSTLAEVDSKPPSKLTIKTVGKGLGKAQQLQGPQVKKYVAGIRKKHRSRSSSDSKRTICVR